MPDGNSAQFQAAFEALQKQGGLKTWSLIVTLLGDIAPQGESALDSQLMQNICAPFGVKPEAFRVALHRLRKDGWITSQKRGRHRAYLLTEFGQTATRAAYERIYRGPCFAPENWTIALVEDAQESDAGLFLKVAPNILVGHENTCLAGDLLSVKTGFNSVPNWMKTALSDNGLAAEFVDFTRVLEQIKPPESAAEKLCLRILVLHFWRRLLLRQPDLPEVLLGPEWPGYEARCKVAVLFEQLERPSLQALEQVFMAQVPVK